MRSIHWHANPAIRVEYVATDAARETIPYVKVTYAERAGEGVPRTGYDRSDASAGGSRQTMDCRDCHNRSATRSPQPLSRALIRRSRPRRSVASFRSCGVKAFGWSRRRIRARTTRCRRSKAGCESFYASQGSSADEQALSRSIIGLQDVYRRNVFPTMMVSFGSYPDQQRHISRRPACFRCHDDSHTASDGSTISAECELCHTQLETARRVSLSE